MRDRLQGKVAVVSGGGRGIGRAVALLLAVEKASVVVNDTDDVDGTTDMTNLAGSVVAEITNRGGAAITSYEDISTMTGAQATIQKAVDTYGRLDILVNSVNVRRDQMISKMSPEDWDVVIRNNLKGVFSATRYSCTVMRQQRSGHIVNLTSDAGLGSIGMSNYAAASEAVIGMTRTVARDMGRYGVTCNAVSTLASKPLFPNSPSPYTPTLRTAPSIPEFRHTWNSPVAPDDPENVAPLVVYLCTGQSPNANGYVFGVRGGSIYLYTDPEAHHSIYKMDTFTVDELDELVPDMLLQDE